MSDTLAWTPRARPVRAAMDGRHVRLEPLDAARHGDGLFTASSGPDAAERHRFLGEEPPGSRAAFQPWLERAAASDDPLFFAVVDRASGKVAGRQAFLRIDAANGVIEIGAILWSAAVARKPAATEAFYLFVRHAFDRLGYRRLEWKCNALNRPSRNAAERFGFVFEGVFRQHMVVKGRNRDTAWFSMLDREWPAHGSALEAWLDPENFDNEGRQKERLADTRMRTAAIRDR